MSAPRIQNLVYDTGNSVGQAINAAAARTGVDFSYLYNQARVESGLNAGAQAPNSSAHGLFQFIDQTWLGTLKNHGAEHGYGWAADAIERRGGRWVVADPAAKSAIFGLRGDPSASSMMAAEFAKDNAAELDKALDRPVNSTDLYFAHFLGAKGASRFLQAADANPDASAASLFPKEAGANRSVFFRKNGEARSLGDVYALMARKIQGSGDAPVQMASNDAVKLVDVPASSAAKDGQSDTMLALADRRTNYLRPQPQMARLAYLIVASGAVI